MITSRIKKRHLFFFILLAVGLVLSLTGIAFFRGEQSPSIEELI
jgi:hypothetical protein